jgi:hypothetical protein
VNALFIERAIGVASARYEPALYGPLVGEFHLVAPFRPAIQRRTASIRTSGARWNSPPSCELRRARIGALLRIRIAACGTSRPTGPIARSCESGIGFCACNIASGVDSLLRRRHDGNGPPAFDGSGAEHTDATGKLRSYRDWRSRSRKCSKQFIHLAPRWNLAIRVAWHSHTAS